MTDYRELADRLRAMATRSADIRTHSAECWRWHEACAIRAAADALDLLVDDNKQLKRELNWESDPDAIDYRAIVEDADTVTVVEVPMGAPAGYKWAPPATRRIVVGSEDVIRERLVNHVHDYDHADDLLAAITGEDDRG